MREATTHAIELLLRFADRTGLTTGRPPKRYLWTDAFAVCTLHGVARVTGDNGFDELALRLVDQVHHVLGRHRPDDPRAGWISGLSAAEGEAHPTRGGLRIGKPLPERPSGEPFDERLEWDRDGQYFHYLTKWMHALDQVSRWTGQPLFGRWARELADVAHRAFTYAPRPGGTSRMYWKMSVDLSRPLVESMGQHDPVDGFVTCAQLEASGAGDGPSLRGALGDFGAMMERRALATADPLGIGGLLTDACRLAQLETRGALTDADLIEALLAASITGLQRYVAGPDLRAPARRRLAFRELGLAIGLAGLESATWKNARPAARAHLDHLAQYTPLRAGIEAFWLEPSHRRVDTWLEHEDINDVMLATSLEPDGFLSLSS